MRTVFPSEDPSKGRCGRCLAGRAYFWGTFFSARAFVNVTSRFPSRPLIYLSTRRFFLLITTLPSFPSRFRVSSSAMRVFTPLFSQNCFFFSRPVKLPFHRDQYFPRFRELFPFPVVTPFFFHQSRSLVLLTLRLLSAPTFPFSGTVSQEPCHTHSGCTFPLSGLAFIPLFPFDYVPPELSLCRKFFHLSCNSVIFLFQDNG